MTTLGAFFVALRAHHSAMIDVMNSFSMNSNNYYFYYTKWGYWLFFSI